ncbi:MAG TPA: hypothetical protein VNS19_10250 [Acidimicrobiales bacterium]|nr:hypothetical protein [Acidimicrobiales bacterium]
MGGTRGAPLGRASSATGARPPSCDDTGGVPLDGGPPKGEAEAPYEPGRVGGVAGAAGRGRGGDDAAPAFERGAQGLNADEPCCGG